MDNKTIIENSNEEELMKKKYDLKSKLNEIEKQKLETELRINSDIMKNEKNTNLEEYKLNTELDINKKKIEDEKDSKFFDIEYNKRYQILNQTLKSKEDDNSLNILFSQIMMQHMMTKNQINPTNI